MDRGVTFVSLLLLGILPGQFVAGEGLDVERFKPSLDMQGLVLTEGGEGEIAGDLNLGFFLHYSRRPLVVTNKDGGYLRSLVDDRLGASFYISMGLLDWLTVGIEVPAAFYQDGDLLDESGTQTSLTSAGLGDIRIAPKVTILRQASLGLSVAFQVPFTLPSGDESAFLGSDTISAMPMIAISRHLLGNRLQFALNVGSWIRQGATLQDLDTSHEFFYRAGARVSLADWLQAIAEISGAARIETIGKNKPNETPLEWLFALRYKTPADVHITLGGGGGALPGWGTPNFRAFLGVVWAPRSNDRDKDGIDDDQDRCPDQAGPRENEGCPWKDSDSDGLSDERDVCPHTPGPAQNKGCPWGDADGDGLLDNVDKCPDKPGPKTNGGCPLTDSDSDGIADDVDKCPQQPGPQQNAGCPWGDRDSDGIKDDKDKCPEVAGPAENGGCPFSDADQDGIKDYDDVCPKQAGPIANAGCPWGDMDGDGLNDNVDKCPKEKEDMDNFEDEDGCPELDNDKDGVLDANDKCPLKPETINGYKDQDGCPDKGKVVVVVRKEKIEILQKIYFATGKSIIKRKSYNLLNQVAQVIRAHSEIKLIQIEGHTDSQGSKRYNQRLSQRRAEAVRRYMINKGDVDPDRLEAVGYGEAKPISSNRTSRGREQNRRVEFVISSE